MIYVVETEERSLYEYADASEAIQACEALDVEAAMWLFWDETGQPLEPIFTTPNKRGLFRATNGEYHLEPADVDSFPHLSEAIEEVLNIEKSITNRSIDEVRRSIGSVGV
ncbi:MAG: hypothetical protein ACFHX7_20760 [Pseudomonadota bacterium]